MPYKPLIFIADNDDTFTQGLSNLLKTEGMDLQVSISGNNALRFLHSNFANLALLNTDLPDLSGFEILKSLKKQNINIPVIFIASSTSKEDEIIGLNLGADDYIQKPFCNKELLARIYAVLRRTQMAKDQNITENAKLTHEAFYFCNAQVKPKSMIISFVNGASFKIGSKELGLMLFFANNPKKILTRKHLIHSVWGEYANVQSRSLDQYITKIRKTLSTQNTSTKMLKTIHGVGFTYEP